MYKFKKANKPRSSVTTVSQGQEPELWSSVLPYNDMRS